MAIDDDIKVLERVPTFAVLGRDALRILAIGAESRYVHNGEVLFSIGDVSDAGYLVQKGSFSLQESASGGSTPAIIVQAGALLGEFALITESTRPMTAIALEPSTVLRIPRGLFLKMLEGFPEAASRLRDYIGARAVRTVDQMQKLSGALDPHGRRR
ncbi:MAG TPA: Crp/Fnr family transcriptional regulator [Xanthobacteraceae bacterium]|nr:Crp/Fnr family transcriptional regulator [Xanthobacteraceae bacterium]